MDTSISQITEARVTDSSSTQGSKYLFIVVMGVSGTGKTTLGSALAGALGFPYVEGDDLHPQHNVEKMSAGTPLTDSDREPWLELIRMTAKQLTVGNQENSSSREDSNGAGSMQPAHVGSVRGVVITCSALKKYYRDILRGRRKPTTSTNALPSRLEPSDPNVLPTYFVFIDGPREILRDRMENRPGHFMKAGMLDSQLKTLESPVGEEGVIVVSLESDTDEQVRVARKGLESLDWNFEDSLRPLASNI